MISVRLRPIVFYWSRRKNLIKLFCGNISRQTKYQIEISTIIPVVIKNLKIFKNNQNFNISFIFMVFETCRFVFIYKAPDKFQDIFHKSRRFWKLTKNFQKKLFFGFLTTGRKKKFLQFFWNLACVFVKRLCTKQCKFEKKFVFF